jgi:hypothetical protein
MTCCSMDAEPLCDCFRPDVVSTCSARARGARVEFIDQYLDAWTIFRSMSNLHHVELPRSIRAGEQFRTFST